MTKVCVGVFSLTVYYSGSGILLLPLYFVRQSQFAAVGDRAFAVASPVYDYGTVCQPDIAATASNTVWRFRRELKTFLFKQKYPSILF